jgi:uncharacterized protein YwqG
VPALPSARVLSEGELVDVAQEVGLGSRIDDVHRLTRTGLRLTHGGSGRSRLGGTPDVPPGFSWPSWNGRELGFVGQIDVAAVADVVPTLLPSRGLLLFFYDLARLPSGLDPAHRGSCRVVHVDAAAESLQADEHHASALAAAPLALSAELIVPSAWSFHVEELELSADELDAWDELRRRVADAQGVQLEEASPDTFALHRLLGYADELGRELEIDCQLASAGLDADDVGVYFEARVDHEQAARGWQMLLQLSDDPALGANGSGRFSRLYVCLREDDLRSGNFAAAWAALRE